MRCFICYNDVIGLEILAMHTKWRKGLIAHHKLNGITTMKKHVESNHFAILKKLVEDPNIVSTKAPFDQEPNKKRHVFFHLQFLSFFPLQVSF
jgi:hypothetical protein